MADDNTPNRGVEGLSEQAYEIARRRQAAAAEVVTMLEDEYDAWFGASAATLLRACAWLAGTSLYRSFGFEPKIAPGTPVLSDRSSADVTKLLKVFMFLVDKYGIKLQPDDYKVQIPADKQPSRSILDVQERFQERYNEIMQQQQFDYADGARTGAVACAGLMKLHCLNRADLEPPVAAMIVTMGFTEGAKTAPAPIK